ncbi:MAG: hypothetical protein GY778_16360 [bacterium]|nr:hypothetical protein [bacterium]
MSLTCPSCRHNVEAPADPGGGTVKCGNCGAAVPVTPPVVPAVSAGVPIAPVQPEAPASGGAALASLVLSLVFFIPFVTQVLALGFGLYALMRKAPDGRRPRAAWAGVILAVTVGMGWVLLMGSFAFRSGAGGGYVAVPYAGPGYGRGGVSVAAQADIGRRDQAHSALERIGHAVAAYRRDMGRWPEQISELSPTYLSTHVLDEIDPDRTPSANRLLTLLGDVDPHNDPPERIVCYSVRLVYDDLGEALRRPHRLVLRLNGDIEALEAEVVEQELTRRGHLPPDLPESKNAPQSDDAPGP